MSEIQGFTTQLQRACEVGRVAVATKTTAEDKRRAKAEQSARAEAHSWFTRRKLRRQILKATRNGQHWIQVFPPGYFGDLGQLWKECWLDEAAVYLNSLDIETDRFGNGLTGMFARWEC